MLTEELIPMANKNSLGEHLDNVDILLAVNDNDTVTINIHAITSERDDEGFPMESTGRHLLTLSAPSDDCSVFTDERSYRHLDEALEDGWYLTQKTEKLIRAAAEAGLEIVRMGE